MRKISIPLLLTVIALLAPSPGSAAPSAGATGSSKTGSFVPGRALVRFVPGTPQALTAAAHARAGATVKTHIALIGYDSVTFDPSLPMDAVLASYRNDPTVRSVEPDYTATIATAPNDPCLTSSCGGVAGQWAAAMTVARATWTPTLTAAQKMSSPKVTVAVLDTKIDTANSDFIGDGGSTTDAMGGGQIDKANGRDWIPSSQRSGAAEYHGTYVAGLVAAATNNGRGIASIGSRATILPLTVVDGTGKADAASLAEAIIYARQHGARVINLSLGLTADSSAVHDAIRSVTTGTDSSLVVAAAGNNTGSQAFYPGSYPEVMSVAGTNPADQPAACSNYNSNVSVSAPAERVVSLDAAGGTVAPQCGTSAAAPQVSGLAADLFAQDAARTPADVRRIIEQSADDLGAAGRDNRFGNGRINADRALNSGASTTLARASLALRGRSTVTAVASSTVGVRAARAYLDNADSTPVALSAADGAFGNATESVTGTMSVPAGTAAGAHPIFVQAFDGSLWGPLTAGVMLVDSRAPIISSVTATNAVRATGQAAAISFTLGDDTPYALALGIQVFDATNHEVFRDSRPSVPQGGRVYDWIPASGILPGSYQIKIIAADLTGKSSAVMVGAVVA